MSKNYKTLYLIDGANYFFRAYYAIRSLTNSKGFPTNALYGFTQMLLKLLKTEEPDYIACCLDTKEPTFRDKMYEDYKANRKAPPDDLVQQFPYMTPIIEALGISVAKKPGFEADDIIGTLAERFADDELKVVVVSGDKDLMQLVGENISMLDEMKELRIGPKEVRDRFGVEPGQVVDVLALSGDKSDNIPGVSGIGLKTASQLIDKYGSLEEVLEHVADLSTKAGSAIFENVDEARLSKKLVTIDRDVPLKFDLKDLKRRPFEREQMLELFKDLEFFSLLEKYASQKGISYEKYRLISNEKDLKEIVNFIKNKKIFSIDLKTDSLDPMQAQIVGIALSWEEEEAAYVPIGHVNVTAQLPRKLVYDELRPVLADKGIRKVGQNLNYALTILRREGFDVHGVEFDTMLASYVIDPSAGHSLDSLARIFLDHSTIRYADVTGKGKEKKLFARVDLEMARDYACEDADVALRLENIFKKKIDDEGLSDLFYKIEMPLLDVLVSMQLYGVKVDTNKLSSLGAEFSQELGGLEKKIHELAGEPFNINSPKQLGIVLFEKLGLPGGKKTKTGFSTSQNVLEDLADKHDLPSLVLRWRSLGKLKSTYTDALANMVDPSTKRVHTTFNQATTATGRLSSSDPNLQNIPVRTEEGRLIREAFVAEDGSLLLSADYSQIELRVLAEMSGEEALISAFRKGEDVHALTAAGIFGVPKDKLSRDQRAVGKTVNFATIYGQTAFGLSRQLGISPGQASEYINNYFNKYPRVAAYRDELLDRVREESMATTLFGRRRFFPDIESSNIQVRQLAERMAFNTVFQGSAADIIKRAMIEVHAGLSRVSAGARLILQVHDELILEVPESDVESVRDFVIDKMVSAADLKVPLVVDVGVGKNWAEAH
ncbi:MAG: DNA polymerase I [Pseudomonadota bacterium]